jgi:2-iminoacetate synthase
MHEGVLAMYNCKSNKATEFINDEEILDTIAYARENKSNRELIDSILEKAKDCKGLSHREAAVLLECDLEDENEKMKSLAMEIKQKFYGNRIVMFAPLYLSNYCINGCVYCPYHMKNKTIPRKKLTQEEIAREVIALQDMGHKRLALETGEDPVNNPIEYVLESIKTIYSIKHKNGAIRRVNVNIAATTVENYRKLKDAGIGTYILFQETYNKKSYEELHPTGPKHDYAYHTEAMDRAMDGGIDDVGLGVLFGLNLYRYDFVGLLMHAEHLEAAKGVGPHTISVPRIRPADDINPEEFTNAISDDIFAKIVAVLRIAVPYTGLIISTRESKKTRERVLHLGVSQISGGSRTSVGGYVEPEEEEESTAQFDVDDRRSLDEVVNWLLTMGYIPSFCTACYREGRTGDRFMSLVKSGQIANCCHPNALMTLKEYLEDYASEDTRKKGETVIANQIPLIPNEKVRKIAMEHLTELHQGKRDFRF